MPVNILMPALSPTMEKGNLAKWLKKEGDKVRAGDVIAEIETDKATMEYEAIDDGVLAKIVVPEGATDVPVNELIAVLAEEGEDPKAAAAAAGKGAAPAGPANSQEAAKPNAPKSSQRESGSPSPQPSPQRGEGAATRPSQPPPSPPGEGTGTSAPPAAAASPPPQRGEGRGDGARANGVGANRVFASPLARRLAKEAGIEIGRIQGSGPHGRVIARDVEAAKSGKGVTPAPAPAGAALAVPPSDEKIRALFVPGSFEAVSHDTMRKVIARRLLEATQTIPHFYLTIDCNIAKLLSAREEINSAAPKDKDDKPAYKLSVNDFVIKALALALQRIPEANVTWTEGAMLKHKHSDIGVAVAIPGGLITPIVRKAEMNSLSVISNEMKDYAARARARKLNS